VNNKSIKKRRHSENSITPTCVLRGEISTNATTSLVNTNTIRKDVYASHKHKTILAFLVLISKSESCIIYLQKKFNKKNRNQITFYVRQRRRMKKKGVYTALFY
jgi:hypothetical protein